MDASDIYPEILIPFDPRHVPLAPPTVDVCAGPVVTVCMNVQWWAHVSGVIQRLIYRDAWKGTEEEISDAIASIYEILDVGRPTMACGCGCGGDGLQHRFNADGVYQTSYDGGATWVDTPAGDYRNNVTLMPPLPGADGDDKKCQTATNIRGHIEHQADQLAADGEAWGEISLLIAAFIGLLIFVEIIGTLGAATPLVLALGGALLTTGQAAFEAAMTTEVFDTFECLLYCNMQDDGTFSDENLTAINAGIASDIGGIAQTYLLGVMNTLGTTGLENMGRTGSGLAADCSDCECPVACTPEGWANGFWLDGVWYVRGTIAETGADYVIINSFDRGDGQQCIAYSVNDRTTCCNILWEQVAPYPSSILKFYTLCGTEANYNTQTHNDLMPGSNSVTSYFFQMDPSATPWQMKFTFV